MIVDFKFDRSSAWIDITALQKPTGARMFRVSKIKLFTMFSDGKTCGCC